MSHPVLGLHHVTAITGDLDRNVDFYTRALGLRLVKRTVNYDDPASYHLYYGDALGRPGTILTFFVWPGGTRGRAGTGQVSAVAFEVPDGSLEFWRDRLAADGISADAEERGGETVLRFADPDGLRLELIASDTMPAEPGWSGGPVPAGHVIRGLHSVTIPESADRGTDGVLRESLGFVADETVPGRRRLSAPGATIGAHVDLHRMAGSPRGLGGTGVVHHVAFRAPDDAGELALRAGIVAAGLDITPPIDRRYFHSLYFREPGGVLFEIATDSPGFTVDEPAGELGDRLALPPWLEPARAGIERELPPILTRFSAAGA